MPEPFRRGTFDPGHRGLPRLPRDHLPLALGVAHRQLDRIRLEERQVDRAALAPGVYIASTQDSRDGRWARPSGGGAAGARGGAASRKAREPRQRPV
jgi:hypothetical protein